MFNEDNHVWRFKYALIFGILFLVSAYQSWQELVYLVRGRTARANATENYTQSSGRFMQNKHRVLEYSFSEEGGLARRGADTFSIEEPVPGQVLVQYTPGTNGRSRLQGHVGWVWIAFFSISIAGLAWAGYRLNKQIDEAMAPRRKWK